MASRYQKGNLRIIAGRWRHRTIHFVGPHDLRPTPDVVRETLFNWLAPFIEGANCLDLFSGSGALGYEAASRGASRVDLVDHDRTVYQKLIHTRNLLSANQVYIHCEDALTYLSATSSRFDIVFLDPPFRSRLTEQVATALENLDSLRMPTFVYLETSKENSEPTLSANWHLYRKKLTGRVAYQLYKLSEMNG